MHSLLCFMWNKLGMTIPKLIGLHPLGIMQVQSYLGKCFIAYKGIFLSFSFKTFTNIFFGSSPACKRLKSQSCKTNSEGGLRRTDFIPEYSVSKRKIWSLPLICYFQLRIYSENPPFSPLLPLHFGSSTFKDTQQKGHVEGSAKMPCYPTKSRWINYNPCIFSFLNHVGVFRHTLLFVLNCR